MLCRQMNSLDHFGHFHSERSGERIYIYIYKFRENGNMVQLNRVMSLTSSTSPLPNKRVACVKWFCICARSETREREREGRWLRRRIEEEELIIIDDDDDVSMLEDVND